MDTPGQRLSWLSRLVNCPDRAVAGTLGSNFLDEDKPACHNTGRELSHKCCVVTKMSPLTLCLKTKKEHEPGKACPSWRD